MSELKATLGPWHVEHDGRFADVVDEFGDCISACIPLYAANLVASAPEMYKLLEVARCPNSDCIDGAIPYGPNPDGDWECSQCQWCYERELVLAKVRGEK